MDKKHEKSTGLHLNYEIITKIIEENSKILDLGCGDGTLLKMLIKRKNCTGSGIEIDQKNAISAIEKGLSIIQGDIDEGLQDFSDNEYDYIILNQTLQSTEKPDYVIEEMLRAGKKAVVSFPNFAYWKVRFYLFFKGKMPKSDLLPFEWYNTPNIHLLTIKDFFEFCKKRNIKILKEVYLNNSQIISNFRTKWHKNLFAQEAIFVISQ